MTNNSETADDIQKMNTFTEHIQKTADIEHVALCRKCRAMPIFGELKWSTGSTYGYWCPCELYESPAEKARMKWNAKQTSETK